ncbi:hypothetical protein K501DRAFT_189372 [Backusella circina FSU 941]|nr:hypothetical protein K501DRAFT_202566 [Backusella circina FSU 941]KAI8881217.1 hypothetical protein K501DRAFT_189372 [Backusella circina FSU 941]
MPGPGTLFTLGAVGVAGAAAYVRRNSLHNHEDHHTPIELARQTSSSIPIDHDYQDRKQPEYLWRRDNGVNLSHNSKPKFPTTVSPLEQTSK